MKWTFNGTGNYEYASQSQKYLPHGFKQLTGTLLEWCDMFIEYEKMRGKKTCSTIQTYRTRKKNLVKFLSHIHSPQIRPNQVTIHLAEDYERYLRTTGLSNDYIMKNILFMRRVLRYVVRCGDLPANPLNEYEFSYERKFKHNHITMQDLQKIKDTHFAQERLARVRDLFVFCCYTGLSYCDLIRFDYKAHCYYSNGSEFIRIKRGKTSSETLLPLFGEAKEILARYNYQLPVISNFRMNSYLKEVQYLCGLEVTLTTHAARKTFGMIMLNEYKYSLEAVSRMLGHNSISTTQSWYVKVEEQFFILPIAI